MHVPIRVLAGGLFACYFSATLLVAQDANAPTTILVDDDHVQCPTATFVSIQDAVNHAPSGAHIRVCAGTYVEQVAVTKPVTIAGDDGAMLIPLNMVQNASSLTSGNPIAAAIFVQGTTGVSITGLTIDGVNNNIGGCGPDLIGVYYQNASGSITTSAIRNFKLSAGLNGCQSGEGIFVQSGGGGTSIVTVMGNSVHDYQKNGITGNEIGTAITITSNVVAGLGPTTGAAQNGIQLAFGATGSITSNIVSNNIWSPCTVANASTCAAAATDILVFSSNSVTIKGNTVGESQIGIYVGANSATLTTNNVFNIMVYDGIDLIGDSNTVKSNNVTKCDESSIFIQGNGNAVTTSTLNEAPVGILKAAGFTGTFTGNIFLNTPVKIQDPPAVVRPVQVHQ